MGGIQEMKLVKRLGAVTLASAMVMTSVPVTLMASEADTAVQGATAEGEETSEENEAVAYGEINDEAELAQAKENLETLLAGLPVENDELDNHKARMYTARTWARLDTARDNAQGALESKDLDTVNSAIRDVTIAKENLARLDAIVIMMDEVDGLVLNNYNPIQYTDTEIQNLEGFLNTVKVGDMNQIELGQLIVDVRAVLDQLANNEMFEIDGLTHIEAIGQLEDILNKVDTFKKDELVYLDLVQKAVEIIKTQDGEYTGFSIEQLQKEVQANTGDVNALQAKIDALVKITDLRDTLQKAESISEADDYTASSWAEFVQTIKDAREEFSNAMIHNPCENHGQTQPIYGTQKEADDARDAVKDAMAKLVYIKPLKDLVTEANKFEAESNSLDYTASSWQAMLTAKEEVYKFLEETKQVTLVQTSTDVDKYYDMVKKLIFGQESTTFIGVKGNYKDSEHVGPVNIVELKALIAHKSELSKVNYIEKYWNFYETAVNSADTMLKHDTMSDPVTKAMVKDVTSTIEATYAELMQNVIDNSSFDAYKEKAKEILDNKEFFNIIVPGNMELTVEREAIWHNLVAALKDAEAAVAPTESLINNIRAAIEGVQQIPGKTFRLEHAIKWAQTIQEKQLMPSAWKTLQANIAAAQALVDSYSLDTSAIKVAMKSLSRENYALRTTKLLRETRENAINLYSPCFDDAAFATLKAEITTAQKIADYVDTTLAQVELDLRANEAEQMDVWNQINALLDEINDPTISLDQYSQDLRALNILHAQQDELARKYDAIYAKGQEALDKLGASYEALKDAMENNSVMKGALQALVTECEAYRVYAYEDNEWVIFREKLAAAGPAISTGNVRTMVSAYRELVAAEAQLKDVNAGTLKTTLANAERRNPDAHETKYTVLSWHAFKAATKTAKELSTLAVDTTSPAIKAAQLELAKVEAELEIYIGTQADLQAILDACYTNAEADYTTASWSQYVAARTTFFDKLCATSNGKVVIDKAKFSTYAHKISELRAIEDAFVTAAEALVEKDGVSLDSLIKEAQTKVEKDYTADSWSVFAKALESAKAAMKDGKPSTITAAKNELRTAMNALVVQEREVSDFVKALYEEVLGRDAETEGLNYWLQGFSTKTLSAKDALNHFVASDEYTAKNTTDKEFVDMLYKVCLGRDAETEGANYWLRVLASGASRSSVMDVFTSSDEFVEICNKFGIEVNIVKDLTLKGFVTRFYEIGLGRAPEAEGLKYWMDALTNQTLNGSSLAKSILLSEEFTNRNLTDTEYVNVMYSIFFSRAGEEAGVNYWLGVLAAGKTREDVLDGFIASNEYQNLCTTYGILR